MSRDLNVEILRLMLLLETNNWL